MNRFTEWLHHYRPRPCHTEGLFSCSCYRRAQIVFYLFDTTNQDQAEYLNSALRRYGVDSTVFVNGLSPEGEHIYTIACPHAAEAEQARHLLYTDRAFVNDLHPEFASKVRAILAQNTALLTQLLSSKTMLVASGLALATAFCGYLLDL